jgi:hypothetical protein
VLLGNHDLGFHYVYVKIKIIKLHLCRLNKYRNEWFEREFNIEHVQLRVIDGNLFILLTSMGLEEDGCQFCEHVMRQLYSVNRTLNCLKNNDRCVTFTFL